MDMIRTYKLLRCDDTGIHPLFIDRVQVLPIGEWISARAPDDLALQYVGTGFALIDLQRQRPLIMQDRRPRRNHIDKATADGCRWVEVRQGKHGRNIYDLGLDSSGKVTPFAHRPGWHSSAEPNLPGVNMADKVWAECLIPANEYYIRRMSINGMTAKSQPVEWYISQRILIERIME